MARDQYLDRLATREVCRTAEAPVAGLLHRCTVAHRSALGGRDRRQVPIRALLRERHRSPHTQDRARWRRVLYAWWPVAIGRISGRAKCVTCPIWRN